MIDERLPRVRDRRRAPVDCVPLGRDEVETLSADRRFFPTPYGRRVWISMWIDGRPPWKLVKEMASRESTAAML